MNDALVVILAVVGAPVSIVTGAALAYLRCRARGELKVVPRDQLIHHLGEQA